MLNRENRSYQCHIVRSSSCQLVHGCQFDPCSGSPGIQEEYRVGQEWGGLERSKLILVERLNYLKLRSVKQGMTELINAWLMRAKTNIFSFLTISRKQKGQNDQILSVANQIRKRCINVYFWWYLRNEKSYRGSDDVKTTVFSVPFKVSQNFCKNATKNVNKVGKTLSMVMDENLCGADFKSKSVDHHPFIIK